MVTLRQIRSSVVLGAAMLLLCAAAWIVLPPFTAALLPLAVGAPELSPWLLALALLIVLAARLDARGSRAATASWVLACVAAALPAAVLVRVPIAAARFDATVRDTLDRNRTTPSPADLRARMRPRPVVVADLFRGIHAGAPKGPVPVVFTSPQGVPLRMNVYAPPTPGPHPGIVQVYGGAWQRGNPEDGATFAQYFANQGYVVFAIDYRHAPEWRWPAQIDDVLASLRWIHRHGGEHGADVTRLALWGRSSGAHLALLAAYLPGGPPVKAVIGYYAPTDLVRGYREPPRPDPLDVRAILEAFIGGTPDTMPDAYRDASPLTYATRPLPPTLLVYGARDHIVRSEFGAALHDRLRATGTTSVFLEIPWAEHAFDAVTFGPSAQLSLYHAERFLAKALQKLQ